MIDPSQDIFIKDDELNEKFNKIMETIPHFETDQETIDHYLTLTSKYRWRIVTPFALGLGAWDNWRDQLQARFPRRTFVQVTLPRWWKKFAGYKIKRILHDLKWEFIHRYVERHQYNVLRPKTLEPGYYDPDTRILHACMEDLRNFYERGAPQVVWEEDSHHQHAYKEMTDIYTWWTQEYPTREEKWEEANPSPDVDWKRKFSNKHETDSDVVEWRRVAKLRHEIETKWAQDEEDMLIRLMKIRRSLWYP